MTVIAVKDGVMAADSGCFADEVRYPLLGQKIVRFLSGDLVGFSGNERAAIAVQAWMSKTELLFPDLDGLECSWLRLKPRGLCYHGSHKAKGLENPVRSLYAIGNATAAIMAEGAMYAGASAAEAVQIAIDRCVWVAGPVQVEYGTP